MYEARLYLMNNAQSITLNGYPEAWEQGLYGNVSNSVGGYNFQSDGYRGVAYASCEHFGQDMFLNYTATTKGQQLYQVVFIGEVGSGTIQFMLKTQFSNLTLTPLAAPTQRLPKQHHRCFLPFKQHPAERPINVHHEQLEHLWLN